MRGGISGRPGVVRAGERGNLRPSESGPLGHATAHQRSPGWPLSRSRTRLSRRSPGRCNTWMSTEPSAVSPVATTTWRSTEPDPVSVYAGHHVDGFLVSTGRAIAQTATGPSAACTGPAIQRR